MAEKADKKEDGSIKWLGKAMNLLVAALGIGLMVKGVASVAGNALVKRSSGVRKFLSMVEDTAELAGKRVKIAHPEFTETQISEAVAELKKFKTVTPYVGMTGEKNLLNEVIKEDQALVFANDINKSRLTNAVGYGAGAITTGIAYDHFNSKDSKKDFSDRVLAGREQDNKDQAKDVSKV